jgi:hypothetical protein
MLASVHGRILDSGESATPPTVENQCTLALEKLRQVVLDGLRHGFFECSVQCDMTNGKRRRLVIKAGVSHQFTISADELESNS